jgi:thioredoxin 1
MNDGRRRIFKGRRARGAFNSHHRRARRPAPEPEDDQMANVMAVTDADFRSEVEQHEGLAVVDFWATWCAPCRMIAPILDQLAGEYEGKAKVAKLDVDSNQATATKFKVRSIPTILFFKNGQLVDQVVGAVPKPKLEEVFRKHGA